MYHRIKPHHLRNKGKAKTKTCWTYNTNFEVFLIKCCRLEMLLHLQSDVPFMGRLALQIVIPTATRASPKWDTGRHVDVLHFSRILLLHIHQLLHGPTHALHPHLMERHYYETWCKKCLVFRLDGRAGKAFLRLTYLWCESLWEGVKSAKYTHTKNRPIL